MLFEVVQAVTLCPVIGILLKIPDPAVHLPFAVVYSRSFHLSISESDPITLLRFNCLLVSESDIPTRVMASLLTQTPLNSPFVLKDVACDHVSVSMKSSIGVTISGMDSFKRVLITAICCLLFAFAR